MQGKRYTFSRQDEQCVVHENVTHSASYLHYIDWMERKPPKDTPFNTRISAEARQMIRDLAQEAMRSDADWLEITVRRLHADIRKAKRSDKG